MPINLYGTRETGIGADIAGRAMQPLGRGGMRGRIKSKLFKKERSIRNAVDAWGIDTIMQMQKGSSDMLDDVRQDLQQMRRKANEARQANDVETYKLALQQSLHDRKMLEYADQLNKTKLGDILTGLVSALGTIGLIGYDKGWFEQQQKSTRPGIPTSTYNIPWGGVRIK